jgi:hypothetical protein
MLAFSTDREVRIWSLRTDSYLNMHMSIRLTGVELLSFCAVGAKLTLAVATDKVMVLRDLPSGKVGSSVLPSPAVWLGFVSAGTRLLCVHTCAVSEFDCADSVWTRVPIPGDLCIKSAVNMSITALVPWSRSRHAEYGVAFQLAVREIMRGVWAGRYRSCGGVDAVHMSDLPDDILDLVFAFLATM